MADERWLMCPPTMTHIPVRNPSCGLSSCICTLNFCFKGLGAVHAQNASKIATAASEGNKEMEEENDKIMKD